jgi:hypothetical protein
MLPNKIRWTLATAFVLLLGSPPAFAQMMGEWGGGMGMMGGGMHGAPPATGHRGMASPGFGFGYEAPWISLALAHAREIELTADQVNGLAAVRDEFQKEAVRLAGEIRRAEAELGLFYTQRPVNLQAVEAKIRGIAGLEAELRLGRARTLEKGLSLLTAEQQQKLDGIAQTMGHMRGAFMPGGPWEFGR